MSGMDRMAIVMIVISLIAGWAVTTINFSNSFDALEQANKEPVPVRVEHPISITLTNIVNVPVQEWTPPFVTPGPPQYELPLTYPDEWNHPIVTNFITNIYCSVVE